jgi:transcriptional regulator GlxA family with amidase domain
LADVSILTIFVQILPMRVVIYLPLQFYSGVASSLFEIIQVINSMNSNKTIAVEFASYGKTARSRSGIVFPARPLSPEKIDVLLVLAGLGAELQPSPIILEKEAAKVLPIIQKAVSDKALIGASCGGAYFLAWAGLLNGKKATISWWLKNVVKTRFPQVKWEPSRMVVRSKGVYTSGGGFSGFELLSAILIDTGFAKEEKLVRKLMVLPPSRISQVPYEVNEGSFSDSDFVEKVERLAKRSLAGLNVSLLASHLHLSERTLARRFQEELSMSPGKWIQEKRLIEAKALMEKGKLSVEQICFETGYEDLSSFSRLFKRTTGMSPTEYKRHFSTVKPGG